MARTHCIANKPHIYFHRYPSGLGFWRVRKPKAWHSPYGVAVNIRAIMAAAYNHAAKLNRLEQQQ